MQAPRKRIDTEWPPKMRSVEIPLPHYEVPGRLTVSPHKTGVVVEVDNTFSSFTFPELRRL